MRRLDGTQARAEAAPDDVVKGSAWIRALARADEPSRLIVDDVTFAPGARTIWHRHPLGQLLLITAGAGWIQSRNTAPLSVREGDAIWVEPDEEHWHGAEPDTMLRHLSIQEHRDGISASLGEPLARDGYPPEQYDEPSQPHQPSERSLTRE